MADKEKRNLLQKLLDKNEEGAEMMRRFVAEKALGMQKPADQPVTSEDIAEGSYSKIPEGYRQAVQDLDKKLGTPILEPLAKTAVATASEMVSPLDIALMGAGGVMGKALSKGASKADDVAARASEAYKAYKARKAMQELEKAAVAKKTAEVEQRFARFRPDQVDPGVDTGAIERINKLQDLRGRQRAQEMIEKQTWKPGEWEQWQENLKAARASAPEDTIRTTNELQKDFADRLRKEAGESVPNMSDESTNILSDETTAIIDPLKKKKKP
jgi:hypothetical protein